MCCCGCISVMEHFDNVPGRNVETHVAEHLEAMENKSKDLDDSVYDTQTLGSHSARL